MKLCERGASEVSVRSMGEQIVRQPQQVIEQAQAIQAPNVLHKSKNDSFLASKSERRLAGQGRKGLLDLAPAS